jgi:UDP-N-acetylglucosamine--N-acetylmuramyl-(pentapeptide) pyrophosphoryl-undecaprenol N-acetylglucosamine transferase
MKISKTILITGTHHTPAIELINLLKKDLDINWKIVYVAHQYKTETHLIHTIIPKLKVEFFNLDCGKFDRKNLDITLLGIPKIIKAFFIALSLIRKLKPQIVVSFGGYVSVPVVMAAYFNGVPSITHEQTVTNSLATKINSYFATKVALSFDSDIQKRQLPVSKTIVTGNLLRQEIFDTTSSSFKKIKPPIIYFTGGNQGSIFLNELLYQIIPLLENKISVIHQTGKNNDPVLQSELASKYQYFPSEFIESEDIGWVLNNADLIVSRSGANICQEIDVLDKKSLLIPHPFTQQNEQQQNALWLKSRHPKSIFIIFQEKANPASVLELIKKIIKISHSSRPQKLPLIHPLFKLVHEISL